jgi:ceramide glucosyltransferase
VVLNGILAVLALLSILLLLWQWVVALRFPLHRRIQSASPSFAPGVTLLKPLKGTEEATRDCLRSWFRQEYAGPVQILFGVASEQDPVCGVVRDLIKEHPTVEARLVICGPLMGTNAKVSKLVQLEELIRHEIVVVSDADVKVPADFLANTVAPLADEGAGLVNCFYRLANPSNLAMQWEAVAINADFWSQVLQSQSLKPLDFALGAVMLTRRKQLDAIGGFKALADCLADDYQLGNRIARTGKRIVLATVVVECWSSPMSWKQVWTHQLRWARTIRVCQPAPYFFSILSNPTLWPLVWLLLRPGPLTVFFAAGCVVLRVLLTMNLQSRLCQSRAALGAAWLAPIKDLLQAAIWLMAFAGDSIEWRGERMRLRKDGTLVKE